ncbi:MAG TPA: MarR family transcriptional regulator [Pseudomonas xinjiangensis]|uniref:MarR family transcriptional regulator n=2 Tax=root TaxID=1 RepID=A0A7V1FST7_9GAMM|nr:MarR family transcriptional regulator [Halopseudomonas xinjiangensis]HEC48780.1 MarR family transcriptional regulator [Halopseudomonas xinjiangensis]
MKGEQGNDSQLALDNQLCFLLYACSRSVIKAYKPLLDPLGLTYPQYLVMLVLWEWHDEAPQLPTVKALGSRLRLDSGTLTPLLKRLQQLGLIGRQRASNDERQVHLELTREGVAMRDRARHIPQQLACETGADLNELVSLRTRLNTLLQQLES